MQKGEKYINQFRKILHQIVMEIDTRVQEMIINFQMSQQTAMNQKNVVQNHLNQQNHEQVYLQQSIKETMNHHMDHFNHPPC